MPGLLVDGFSHGSQDLQRVQTLALQRGRSKGHQAADGGWRCVQQMDTVLVHQVPEATGVGPGGNAFKHHGGGPCTEWAVEQVGMAGDPPDVCGAKVHPARLVLEDVYKGVGGPNQIPRAGMNDAFGLTGGPRRVQNEKQVLGGHFFGRKKRISLVLHTLNFVGPPGIPAFEHGNRLVGMVEDQDLANRRARHQGIVDDAF